MSLTNHNEILYRARLKNKIYLFKQKFLTAEKQQPSAQLSIYSAASSLDTPLLGLHIRFFNISSASSPTHPCIPTHRCSRMLPCGEKHLPGPCPAAKHGQGATEQLLKVSSSLSFQGSKAASSPCISLYSLPVIGHGYIARQRTGINFFHFKLSKQKKISNTAETVKLRMCSLEFDTGTPVQPHVLEMLTEHATCAQG